MAAAAASPDKRDAAFRPVAFDDLPGWRDDDHAAAFAAFRRSALHALEKPGRSGTLGPSAASFEAAFAAARRMRYPDRAAARTFFETHFRPCRIVMAEGRKGFVTGYYEPALKASRERTADYAVPLYGRPDDLVALDAVNRPPHMDLDFRFGRMRGGRIGEYPDRRAIESGALAGRGLEIAWLADRVDAFFVHVQGAARLDMTDGCAMRVTYAAKSGHPFTGIGRELARMGEIPLEDVTMQSIRAWLSANPERVDEILWANRSFIFFRETELGDPSKGPVAAAKVQLAPGRSLAVDRVLHTFATPFYIDAPGLTAVDGAPFRRLMVAQDTGSAIVGPARGDIFVGTGHAAGEIAGVVKHEADFHALVPCGGEGAA